MTDKNKLVLGDLEAVFWGGNELNAPEVQMEIDAHRVHYDRDYSTEEKITGTYDLSMDEAKELHAFLGRVTATEDDYEYAAQIITGPRAGKIVGDFWTDKEDRESFVKDLFEFSGHHDYKLVRRRKAGPVEDAL